MYAWKNSGRNVAAAMTRRVTIDWASHSVLKRTNFAIAILESEPTALLFSDPLVGDLHNRVRNTSSALQPTPANPTVAAQLKLYNI